MLLLSKDTSTTTAAAAVTTTTSSSGGGDTETKHPTHLLLLALTESLENECQLLAKTIGSYESNSKEFAKRMMGK